jgi:hypothetical protein
VLTIVLYLPGKVFIPKKVVDPIMENVTLEPELEEALANASDAEICDIAGRKTRTFTCAHPFTDIVSVITVPVLFPVDSPSSANKFESTLTKQSLENDPAHGISFAVHSSVSNVLLSSLTLLYPV